MANVDAPFGLRPVGYLNGAPFSGQARKYYVPASDGTALYIGDPVKLGGSADTLGRYASVTKASAGNAFIGVVVGFDPVEGAGASQQNSTIYRSASTERYVYVADDPSLIFEIQEISGGTALTAAAVGLNASFADGGGSTSTGFSGIELDNATEATTNTLDFQLLGVSSRAGNALGEHCVWLVRLNNHQLVDGVTGV